MLVGGFGFLGSHFLAVDISTADLAGWAAPDKSLGVFLVAGEFVHWFENVASVADFLAVVVAGVRRIKRLYVGVGNAQGEVHTY